MSLNTDNFWDMPLTKIKTKKSEIKADGIAQKKLVKRDSIVSSTNKVAVKIFAPQYRKGVIILQKGPKSYSELMKII